MKWFKHDTDMHNNLKIQELIDREGAEGYAVWNLCLEMVGKEGAKGKIESEKRWQKGIKKVFPRLDEGRITKILKTMAEVRLINSKALNYGNLQVPEFRKRSSDWEIRKLRSENGDTPKNLAVDKIRLDKIRKEYIRLKEWVVEDKDILSSIIKRTVRPAKSLLLMTKDDELALRAMRWTAAKCKEKGLSWEIETVIKWFPEYQKYKARFEPDKTPDKVKDLMKGIG